jgi:hypothetical protein
LVGAWIGKASRHAVFPDFLKERIGPMLSVDIVASLEQAGARM